MFLKKHSQPEWTPADRQAVPSVNISSHTIIEKVYHDFFAARQ